MARGTVMRSSDAGANVASAGFEFSKVGAARYDWRDPYHAALTVGWPAFIAALIVSLTAVNLMFAGLYLAQPGGLQNARPGSFRDAFFFSVETFATVGYGEMYPAKDYTHWVAMAEILTGMAFTAIVTGLTFVRFSKPRAKIIYAEHAVVARYNGRPAFMIRFGNGRMNTLTETVVRLSVLIREVTQEGQNFRRVQEMVLANNRFAIFALTLTVMHVIDEDSPLHGMDAEAMAAGDLRFFLSIEARDPGLGAAVFDMRGYGAENVRFGMRYSDTIGTDGKGRTEADLTRVSLLEPDPGEGGEAASTPAEGQDRKTVSAS